MKKKKNLKLKAAITEAGFKNYQEIAREVGVTKQTICRAVAGESIHLYTAIDICNALNKTVDELFN
jgi:DNA-binding XRE family transcriptional regulator